MGSAAAWDLATLSCLFGAILGFFHGARIFESEGLRVGDLGSMIANISPVLGEMIKHAGEAIQTEMYENPESSVKTCTVAFELFVKQAREARSTPSFRPLAWGSSRKPWPRVTEKRKSPPSSRCCAGAPDPAPLCRYIDT